MHASEDSVAYVALLLAVVLVAAKLGGELAVRLKQPPVLGELLAGIFLGNVPWFPLRELGSDATVDMLSRFGVLILLFEVGLESTVRDVLEVGAGAVRVAALGTASTFVVGVGLSRLFMPHEGMLTHVFLGASITATSVGITARVFKDLGQTRSKEARIILGASVVDDVIGLVVLALVSGFITSSAAGARLSPLAIFAIVAKTLGFLAVAVVVGVRATPRIFALAARMRTGGVLLAFGLAFCFFLAWAADRMGLAPLVGAFAAGLVLEDIHSAQFVARGERSLSQLIEPLSEFLVPIFFVVMGIRADMRVFAQPETLILTLVLAVAAVAGKMACGLGASGVNRLAVAFGMIPRGEVSLIFASLGTSLTIGGAPVLDRKAYSALVTVVIVTTILTPMLLKWSFSRVPKGPVGPVSEQGSAA